MFPTETYIQRREKLRKLVGKGLLLLPGNNESPCNYPANAYSPFRQDSSFLYYFGLQREGLWGVIDAESGEEWLLGDDISLDDRIWMGSTPSVAELAKRTGVAQSAPLNKLETLCREASRLSRRIHYLPPYRHDTMLDIARLLGIQAGEEQRKQASLDFIKAVVEMRQCKTAEEIDEIERACGIGYRMHTEAMRRARAGVTEKHVAGLVDGIARSEGLHESFATIFTQHGEIMHGAPTHEPLINGRLALCDAGAENSEGYCSDNTRTYPVSGQFTTQQREIYSIVSACHDRTLDVARPGLRWMDVHLEICRLMTDGLKALGLMQGDTAEAVNAGAHALFMPHGLGHMMGLDVHDMEGLGQQYVGFDDETQPSEQFGTASLRCGKRLKEGFVMTDEPGIYFIPALIDQWRAEGLHKDFIRYDRLENYRNFGGIRIEDDILITSNGCRMLGKNVIPYHADDVEQFIREASIADN